MACSKASSGWASYFCNPQAPWQKGSMEKTNGRISARPIKLFLFVPYFHAGVSNEECRATSKPE